MERLAEQIRRGDYTTWKEKIERTKKYWDLYVKNDIKQVFIFIENLKKQYKDKEKVKKQFIKACVSID
jgi:hypothetical protein